MNFIQLSLLTIPILFLLENSLANESTDNIIVIANPLELNHLYQIVDYKKSELNQESSLSIQDDFKSYSGVQHFQSGGFGKQSSFFLRGGNRGDQAFFIQDVQIQDPLDIDRSIDIGAFGLDLFDEVEIYKGSQSHLGGSNILTGSINFKTNEKIQNNVSLAVGERNTVSSKGVFQNKNTNIRIGYLKSDNISSANEDKNSYAEKDSHKRTTAFLQHKDKVNNSFSYNIFTYINNSDNDIDQTNFSTNLPYDKISSDQSSSNYQLLSSQIKYRSNQSNWASYLQYNFHESERDSSGTRYKGKTKELIQKNSIILNQNQVITMTLEIQEEIAEQGSSINGQNLTLYSEALDYFFNYKSMNFQFGIQHQKYASYEENMPYHLGLSFAISKDFSLQLTHSNSYKRASLYQLFAPEYSDTPVGNPNLKAEEKRGQEVKINFYTFSLSAFYHQFKNIIDYDSDLGYLNRDRARIKGFELSNIYSLTSSFSIQNEISIMSAIDDSSGEYLPRRSRIVNSNKLNYKLDRNQFSIHHHYQGDRNDNGRMPSYQLFDVSFRRSFDSSYLLSILFHNLLDRNYEQIRGYGTFGRFIKVGLTKNF